MIQAPKAQSTYPHRRTRVMIVSGAPTLIMNDDADKKSANADKDDGHAMVVTGVQLSNRAANSTQLEERGKSD